MCYLYDFINVGDKVMKVTPFVWWLFRGVGALRYVKNGPQPFQTCHQHKLSPFSVNNIHDIRGSNKRGCLSVPYVRKSLILGNHCTLEHGNDQMVQVFLKKCSNLPKMIYPRILSSLKFFAGKEFSQKWIRISEWVISTQLHGDHFQAWPD